LRHPATIVICEDAGQSVPLQELKKIVTENCIEVNNTFTNKEGNTFSFVTASSQADRTKLAQAITEQP
jgi:hypothetical protein